MPTEKNYWGCHPLLTMALQDVALMILVKTTRLGSSGGKDKAYTPFVILGGKRQGLALEINNRLIK